MDIKDTTYIHTVHGKAPPGQVAKGQDQHRYKLEWAAPTTCNYNHHRHRPDQDQHGCRIGVTNQGNLCKGTPFNLTQVELIATLVTLVAPVLVLVWSVVVVVVVVACFWCSPLQLAPMLVLTFSNLRWWCFSCINWQRYSTCTCDDDHLLQLALVVFYLPATGANTPFARVQLALCGGGCVVNICGSCVWWS